MLLNHARTLGDSLMVGIDSDERIRTLKGPSRPINKVFERKLMLENLKAVDEVHVFHTDNDLIDLIRQCDIMVKGSDYRGQHIIGADLIEIDFFPRMYGYSTTRKIQDISNR
jgi:D-beta-D-heptose 7-phosphate kinase/D-beta-D-heptose 1-phosphate adenosyltransferase